MPMLVSAIGQHRRPRHTEQIFNPQISACLTKVRIRSVAFVPRHVGATGAQGVSTVESSQCFLVAPRLDVEVLQQCKSSFRISHLYNLRWPAPKRAAEVTTESAILAQVVSISSVFSSSVGLVRAHLHGCSCGRGPWHRSGSWPQRSCNGGRPLSTGWRQPWPNSQILAARPLPTPHWCVQGPRLPTTRQGGAHAPCAGAGSCSDAAAA